MTNAITSCLRWLVLVAGICVSAPAAAQDVMLRGTLSGANVVSATESPGSGEVAAVLGEDDVLRIDMVFAGLDRGATRATLHTGKYNENGPIMARLDIQEGSASDRLDNVQVALTPLTAAAVRAGESYIVVGNIQYPDGALRAQLMPQPVRLNEAPASLTPRPGAATAPVGPAPADEATGEPADEPADAPADEATGEPTEEPEEQEEEEDG